MRNRGVFPAIVLLLLAACSGEPETGPVPVNWDRDTCEHCNMVVSDRRFAVQVRSPEDHRVRHFDDVGCAARWLDERDWDGAEAEEIWVRAIDADRWLPADGATFVAAPNTPMNYGYGATDASSAEGIDFGEVRERIREVVDERRSHHP